MKSIFIAVIGMCNTECVDLSDYTVLTGQRMHESKEACVRDITTSGVQFVLSQGGEVMYADCYEIKLPKSIGST